MKAGNCEKILDLFETTRLVINMSYKTLRGLSILNCCYSETLISKQLYYLSSLQYSLQIISNDYLS
jgi:hypothetical protein